MIAPLAAIATGFVSGLLSGVFGIGGGLVTTPAIRLLLGYPELIAVGTPLPVILPGALTGGLSYLRRGEADLRAGLTMGAVGAAGSVGGALLSRVAGGPVVLVLTAVVIVYAAADMLLQERDAARSRKGAAQPAALTAGVIGEGEADEALLPADELVPGSVARLAARTPDRRGPTLGKLALIGLAAGLYSGFLGLGGGFVVVPGLTRFCGMSVKRAIGTSLITVACLAVPGSITHTLLGHIDWWLALLLALGVVPGAALGARLTTSVSDRALRLAFAGLLAVVAVWLGANELPGLFVR